ncbi:MAG: FAD-dependent oxidoreductase [Bdellovibrionales bacterium]|nr:FAD-dependent oxidoreductase [Bdellovibrionales bacterium]
MPSKTPYWFKEESMPARIPLREDFKTDVCIVGGGIAGLTSAFLLMQEGLKVCVLESGELASGQTGKTTAQFVNALDERFFNIEKYHGEEGLKLAIQSHSEAIRKVENIVRKENIDCDLKIVSGYLFSKDDKRKGILDDEYEAAHKNGLIDVERFAFSPSSSFDLGPCLHFPKQMKLHPIKYLKALAEKILDGGGKIFTHTHVTEVQGGENSFVKTKDNNIVYCNSIIVATNTPINDMFAIHTKQAPYRTYVLGFEAPKGVFPDILVWDTLEPYHYVRLEHDGDKDVLIVGGEDHKTGQLANTEFCYNKLEMWTRKNFPFVKEILYQWSGQVMEPVDGLAFLGHNPMDEKNVYVITGDSGNGMTHSTIGAMLITDQIMNRPNIWAKLYSPSRISLLASGKFFSENLNVAAQYLDWLNPNFESEISTLKKDDGMIFRKNGKLMAAYKNASGAVEYMSASCPHLAGVVTWNSSEKSWDCPCHGSRFDCHGSVIEGPAVSDLAKVNFQGEKIVQKEPQIPPDTKEIR